MSSEVFFTRHVLKILPRFGDNGVGSENSHAIQRCLGFILGRQLASDDAEFPQRSLCLHFMFRIIVSATLFTAIQTEKER